MKPITRADFNQLRRGMMSAWATRRLCTSAEHSESDMETVRLIRAEMQRVRPKWKPRRAARIQPRTKP